MLKGENVLLTLQRGRDRRHRAARASSWEAAAAGPGSSALAARTPRRSTAWEAQTAPEVEFAAAAYHTATSAACGFSQNAFLLMEDLVLDTPACSKEDRRGWRTRADWSKTARPCKGAWCSCDLPRLRSGSSSRSKTYCSRGICSGRKWCTAAPSALSRRARFLGWRRDASDRVCFPELLSSSW